MTLLDIKRRVAQVTLFAFAVAAAVTATDAAAEPAPMGGEFTALYSYGEACRIARDHEPGVVPGTVPYGSLVTAPIRVALSVAGGSAEPTIDDASPATTDAPIFDPLDPLAALPREFDKELGATLADRSTYNWKVNALSYNSGLATTDETSHLPEGELPLFDPLASLPGELDAAIANPEAYRWVEHNLNRGEVTFDVPVVINERVQWYLNKYQTRDKDYFSKWLEKSGAYLPHLKRILREEGVPEDLSYLALIESGFNPYLISRAKAVGVWQFMSETARLYGLRVDWWVDERRDMEKASHAAASFLGDLYERFDSWYLAGAAYNAGPGKISSAIRRHNSRDFWVLAKKNRPLVRETKDYIPKYLAAMMIAKDPKKYGFTGLNYHEPISYEKVMVDRPTDIKVIARAAGTTTKDIKRLNPELRRWFTPPTKGGYEIKIPAGMTEDFHANMADIPKGERLRFHRHKVKYGETLSQIARRYGTALKPIMYLNEIKDPRRVRAGSRIVIPVPEGTVMAKATSTKKRAKKRPQPPGTVPYTVKSGDTLWDLSMKFGVDVKTLKKTNGLGRRSLIRPGQTLYIKTAKL